ncbi:hypothetical protein A2316_01225 [Candidatus Falkowbacteria bacterium RIFOXYB2_FULL_38_15]|uniref:Uncharacterized protein n=1 Tax=Candidatus Falkowbacteria bacterium RIFOXYA2_FULL_38_12 TaxID=1797993 RepID=A0A1F5S5X0_9BACT|nr:MAG: hypothetical protein A2257_02625 [Candidatus Falkowbacteria bacterium RIFOXYA2_FULL_38_12]OGF32802.1 MAG: hypothetical protein A2316_01225 [Candidatus Falkowbacteria bacterium RIFOXYB2_FULL_38_15]OGF42161.1 MAG: hypothetical protein A2555_02665 [Candidatus Falkowbacteria bacterium RIFOXYD2_FULL_39_16]
MFYKINLKKFFIVFTAIILFSAICLPKISSAETSWQSELREAGGKTGLIGGGGEPNTTTSEAQLNNLITRVIQTVLSFVGLVFLVLLVYGGILWMIARGEEAKVTKAKDLIEAAVIGLVIVLAAYGISYFVMQQLGTVTSGAS